MLGARELRISVDSISVCLNMWELQNGDFMGKMVIQHEIVRHPRFKQINLGKLLSFPKRNKLKDVRQFVDEPAYKNRPLR